MEEIYEAIYKETKRLEGKLSRFNPGSDIYKLNHSPGQEIVIDKEVFQVLSTCIEYYQLTEGLFDITVTPLLESWKINHGTRPVGYQPKKKEIIEVLSKSGANNIILNKNKGTALLKNEPVKLDLGGIGKGFALESINHLLEKMEVMNTVLSFGESSVLTRGRHPHGEKWKIGIQHILHENQYLYTFQLNEGAISTSANIEIEENGKSKVHTVNPRTGYPVKGTKTVSVKTSLASMAEALSTALLVGNDKQKSKIIKNSRDTEAVEINYNQRLEANITTIT